MDKINWNNYNGEGFTLFCNALLSFEFGKAYKPFSTAGKDGGIDGAFDGTYLNTIGKWRFQYKFRLGTRAQTYSGLKSTVKNELDSLNDETTYALLTNLELRPKEITELEQILDNEVIRLGKQCKCIVWDGAKLFNLYLQYPLLQLWMQDGFHTAQLQDYNTVFKKELEKTGFLPGTFANTFFARTEDLKGLSNFLIDNNTLALVTGEAGIGKTRLVLEFFRSHIDLDPQWTSLVLLNRNIDFDKIHKALAKGGNYIILIDDAHTYAPEIIADMQRISTTTSNKIKLVLTSRNLEAFKSLNLLKEYEQADIPSFKLGELSRSETAHMFEYYVGKHSHYANFIPQLVQISYGKPILIIAILNAINEGIQVSSIREADFLRNYVINYFNSYYTSVEQLTGWSRSQAKRFLQQVVLIEPFSYKDIKVVQKLTELQGLQTNDGIAALKLLVENDLVDGRYLQSIKPDYYSDILLADIDHNLVPQYIGNFNEFLDNIVINLSSVDESDAHKNNLLNDILTQYVSFIKDSDKIEIVDRVLTTILNIAGYQPKFAQDAIQLYIEGLKNNDHVIHKEWKENKDYDGYSSFSTLNKIIELLSYLSGLAAFYDFTFRKSMQLFSFTEDVKVVGLFAFSKKDVIEKLQFPRQYFFLHEFSKRLKKLTTQELNFGLQVIKSWLQLEFVVSGPSAANRFELNMTIHYLPVNSSVKKLRKKIAELLITVYSFPSANECRLETLKELLDIPRGILATCKNAKPYQNDEEIKIVLNFLEEGAAQFILKEKKEIEEKLFWFRRWGISADFYQQLDAIKSKLSPKNLTEQLSLVFSNAEVSFRDIKAVEVKIMKACDDFVDQYDTEIMANSIVEFLESESYRSAYFPVFLNQLIRCHSKYAKALYLRMKEISPQLFKGYGAEILGGAYYIFMDHDFYWTEVRKLQKSDNADTDDILISVYGRRVPGITSISEDDVEVILQVFNKKRKENNFSLASGIQSLIAAGYDKAQEVCIEFLKSANQQEARMFFIWFSDNKAATDDLLKELVLNHTLQFHLSYEIECCLNKILRFCGLELVLNYLCRRYEYKKAIVTNQKTLIGYEIVPDGNHSNLFDNIPEQKPEMFIKALEWYLTINVNDEHLFYAKDILEYLKPGNVIDNEIQHWFQKKIDHLDEHAIGLDRIMESLSVFETKDDNLLDLVISGYTASYELSETQHEYYTQIRWQCILALTTMGVKTGTPGTPFQVDLDLQNLLQVKISSLPEYLPVTAFLKDVLNSVESEITRSSDRDNLSW